MVLLALVGFYVGFLYEPANGNDAEQKYKELNVTVGKGEDIQTAEFYNQSIDIFHEDGERATFYLDLDQDGSADETLQITHDGEEHVITDIVTLGQKDYRLYFRYRDNATVRDDAYLTLYRAEQLGA